MSDEEPAITPDSTGNPDRFQTFEDLSRALEGLPAAPADRGRVVLLVRRCPGGPRETPPRLQLIPGAGVPGDSWGVRTRRDPDSQITVMQADVAALIANGQPLALSGDNLFLELDLSAGNLPPGSRVRVGGATLEVTPKPHNGCKKFRARFGLDALRFVSDLRLRHRNLRGVHMRAVEAGEVAVGDPVEVIVRNEGHE